MSNDFHVNFGGPAISVTGDQAFLDKVQPPLFRVLMSVTGKAIAFKIRSHGAINITRSARDENNATTRPDFFFPLFKLILIETSVIDGVSRFYVGDREITRSAALQAGVYVTRDDCRLIHEMTHAARWLGGDYKQTPLKGEMKDWETEEEFMAVLVENIFISEIGKANEPGLGKYTNLRYGHGDGRLLKTDTAEGFLHLDDNYRLIEKFCKQHPVIAPMIANAPAAFNPISAYYAERKR